MSEGSGNGVIGIPNNNGHLKRPRSSSPSQQASDPSVGKKLNTGHNSPGTIAGNDAAGSAGAVATSTMDIVGPSEEEGGGATAGAESEAGPGVASNAGTGGNGDSQRDDVNVGASLNGAAGTAEASASSTGIPAPPTAVEAAPSITIRALIVTQDASIIIGKAGSHIKEIREKAGAKVSVSEQIIGNPERILHVSGPLDAVSKVGLFAAYAFGFEMLRVFSGVWLDCKKDQR